MNNNTVYLAGKITGDKNYRRKFKKAEKAFSNTSYIVLSPTILPDHGFDWDSYMNMTKAMMRECNTVAFLPDWEESKGARIEMVEAKEQGKNIILLSRKIHGFDGFEIGGTIVHTEKWRKTMMGSKYYGYQPKQNDYIKSPNPPESGTIATHPQYKSSNELMQEIKAMFDALKNENATLKFENAQLKGKINVFTYLDGLKGNEQFHKVAVTCFSIDDLACMYESSLLYVNELEKIIERIKSKRHRKAT